MKHFRAGLAMALMMLTAFSAAAQAQQQIVTADGHTYKVVITGMDGDTVHITPHESDDAPPAQQFVVADLHRLVFQAGAGAGQLVVDNNGAHDMQVRTGEIRLRTGAHHMTLLYSHSTGGRELRLSAGRDGEPRKMLGAEWFAHLSDGASVRPSPGFDAEGYRLPDVPSDVAAGLRYELVLYDHQNETDVDFADVMTLADHEASNRGIIATPGRQPADQARRTNHFGIRFEGFLIVPEDGTYDLALTSVNGSRLFMGHPKDAPAGRDAEGDLPWRITLTDGHALAGSLGAWDAQQITLALPLSDAPLELQLPAASVREVWSHALAEHAVSLDRAEDPADQDTVYALTGEGDEQQVRRVSGMVQGVRDGALRLRYQDQERGINLDRVVGVVLAAPQAPEPTRDLFVELHLLDGQVILGQWRKLENDVVTFDAAWDQALAVPLDAVAELRVRNGRLVYLSDLQPAEVEMTPYFNHVMPYQTDRSLAGGPLQLADGVHDRGITMHARTVLHYQLDAEFEQFQATLGLEQPAGKLGNVAVRVLGDGNPLYQNDRLSGDDETIALDLALNGIRRLTLEVDFGDGQGVGARAAWADARLLRGAAR